MKKIVSLFLSLMLILSLTSVGLCEAVVEEETGLDVAGMLADALQSCAGTEEMPVELLNGEKEFTFHVVADEETECWFLMSTDKTTVGEALAEWGMIEGEESAYGLYVKTVLGVTADYDTDGTYWAFYINDEYAMTGVDSTPVEEGTVYTFRIEG